MAWAKNGCGKTRERQRDSFKKLLKNNGAWCVPHTELPGRIKKEGKLRKSGLRGEKKEACYLEVCLHYPKQTKKTRAEEGWEEEKQKVFKSFFEKNTEKQSCLMGATHETARWNERGGEIKKKWAERDSRDGQQRHTTAANNMFLQHSWKSAAAAEIDNRDD